MIFYFTDHMNATLVGCELTKLGFDVAVGYMDPLGQVPMLTDASAETIDKICRLYNIQSTSEDNPQ